MAVKVKRRPAERQKKTRAATSSWTDDSTVKGWGNEAFALVLYSVTLFLGVCVISEIVRGHLAPGDTPGSLLQYILDRIGPFGRGAGQVLTGLLGWCALVPVAWLAWLARACWHLDESGPTVEVESRILPAVGFGLMIVFAASLAVLFWGDAAGGAVGEFVAIPLGSFLGTAGATILSISFLLAALSLSTKQSIGVILQGIFFFTKDLLVYSVVLLPLYIGRAVYLGGAGLVSILGWIYDAATSGWRALFSARVPLDDIEDDDEIPLPKPRRRGKNSEMDPEEESSEKRGGFELAPPKGTSKRVESAFDEIGSDEPSEDDEEDYSHVVVMRRKPEDFKTLNAEKAKRKAKAKQERESDSDIQPQSDFEGYKAPDVGLLVRGESSLGGEDDEELLQKSRQIEAKLKDFGILGRVTEVHPGPVITLFEFEPAPGVKVGKIAALQDDLAMSLRATTIRIIAPIPKKGTVGIEVPNKVRDIVRLRDVLESREFVESQSILTVPLGKDTYGDPVFVDVSKMPHLLIAGATGTGKSVCINAVLLSLLYKASPADLGLIMIDPKVLELSIYEGIPHLRVPVVTAPRQAKAVLDWAVKEMERRYRMMQRFEVRNIDGYNDFVRGEQGASDPKNRTAAPVSPSPIVSGGLIHLGEEEMIEAGTIVDVEPLEGSRTVPEKSLVAEELKPLPKIVIVIDELADLMLTVGRDIEELITRLAQKARAAGIHLIVATQRPSVDVITGLIKANFPARLSFRVTSRIDSRTILDSMGAERLLGMGDMLFMYPGAPALKRIHGAFVSDSEVKKVVDAIKETAAPCYDQRILDLCAKALEEEKSGEGGEDGGVDEYDAVYDKAVELVIQKGQASTSMIQRAFRIGYNRAARIIETMEKDGVIGPMDGVKPREVLLQGEKGFDIGE